MSRLLKNKAQTFAEYAAILGVVAAFISGIALFGQRAVQAKIKNAQDSTALDQYEPYYVSSSLNAVSHTDNNLDIKTDGFDSTVHEKTTITNNKNVTCSEDGTCVIAN